MLSELLVYKVGVINVMWVGISDFQIFWHKYQGIADGTLQ
jgi:hypothetical protein